MNDEDWTGARRGERGGQRPPQAGRRVPPPPRGGARPDPAMRPARSADGQPPARPRPPDPRLALTEELSTPQPPPPRPSRSTSAGTRDSAGGTAGYRDRPANRRWGLLAGYGALTLASVLVLSLTGYAWGTYQNLSSGIKKSDVIAGGPKSINGDTNILIMGLDTRLDENGNPLPANIYDALHAGNQADGGNNSNVLMLLHVPGNGSKATAVSIPRDDYVDIPGCPDGQCKGKIKQAYGLAFDQASKKLVSQGVTDKTQRVQAERDAGRQAEIATVRQFLGGVPIDHFIEITLVAFFQIAQVVQPITICVSEDTQDSYSGANFHKGQQQVNASQALAFVRQRRDNVHPALNFTDLDRERRQQAFIASLAYQLKQSGTFTDPTKLSGILTVAKQNMAIDSGLDLLSFAQQASNLTSGNITFFTLPIDHFGTTSYGDSVNFVNLPLIQSTVHTLLGGPSTTTGPAPSNAAAAQTTTSAAKPTAVVDVVNASGRTGYAARLEQGLVAQGFTQGTVGTQTYQSHTSVIEYGSGASSAASAASSLLNGMNTKSDSAISAGTLRIIIGTGFTMPSSMSGGGGAAATTSAPPPASAVSATGGGAAGPPVTALSALSGGGIPCVK